MAKSFEELAGRVPPAVRKTAMAKAARYQRRVDAGNAVRAIRAAADLGQVELARLMNVKQPAVARLERQNDMKLSTLLSIVAAVGGTVRIRVKLPRKAKPIDIDYAA